MKLEEYTIGQWIEENNVDTTKDIYCRSNSITSLKGLPVGFNSRIYCRRNKLTSLEGITNLDPKNLSCDWNKEQIRKEYLRLNLSSLLI